MVKALSRDGEGFSSKSKWSLAASTGSIDYCSYLIIHCIFQSPHPHFSYRIIRICHVWAPPFQYVFASTCSHTWIKGVRGTILGFVGSVRFKTYNRAVLLPTGPGLYSFGSLGSDSEGAPCAKGGRGLHLHHMTKPEQSRRYVCQILVQRCTQLVAYSPTYS